MAKQKNTSIVEADFGRPNSEKQWQFFTSEARYTCYGGARGGGKSWAVVRKAALGAFNYPGIRILILRREYGDMEGTLISPMIQILPAGSYNYNKSEHMVTFVNGSKIKFGNMPGYSAAVQGKYQGQEYEWLFIDEATQFLETEFRGLDAIVRGANKIPKRIYLTCNPGGPGHTWVKRLFVDRKFKKGENPEDYVFIPATVDDNKDLMDADPAYVRALENLPEDIRRAHRHGDWNILAGIFFKEFMDGVHTCAPFQIPRHWPKYRAFDYGLDMFFCLWIAIDETGRCYVYREFERGDMVVSDAARKQLELTGVDEYIESTIAPPDMWARNRETGRTQAEVFSENGVGLQKASNNRVQGWSSMKEYFKLRPDGRPGMVIFENCKSLIDCIKGLQHSKTDPNDVSKEPHGITHGPDALRYFVNTHTLPADKEVVEEEEDEFDKRRDYKIDMCGTGVSRSYVLS
jgi:phage terminase large subunit